MRIPITPPALTDIIQSTNVLVFQRLSDPDVVEFVRRSNDAYVHWDKLRYYNNFPDGFDAQMSWAAVSMSRVHQYQSLPIRFNDSRLVYWNPPQQLESLHKIDQRAGGNIGSTSMHIYQNDGDKERYLINALMEEAIASSQLEGAVTTRKVAKQMLREGRKPQTKAERMILNNYKAIIKIRDSRQERLTVKLLKELHSILTTDTLEDSSAEGQFRKPEEDVVVEDSYNHDTLYIPPPAESIDERIEEICKFANEKSKPFVHPVIKAIVLHFAIGYVHPFVDGNGRTARALFYWYMLKRGYWLFEFLPISRLFLRAPAQYARAYLYTENDNGDATYFIHYNLWVVLRAIKELHAYIARQQEKIAEAEALLSGSPNLNHRQQALIYQALKHPDSTYTIQQYQRTYNVSYGTARSDLLGLSDDEYLELGHQGAKMVFRPKGELLSKLRKLSSSISRPLPDVRRRLPPVAVTRIQERQLPLLGPADDEADNQ
jgi:Fic family protein